MSKSDFVIELFRLMNESLNYVVLRGHEKIPEIKSGDLDLMIAKKDLTLFKRIITDLISKSHAYRLEDIDRNYVYMFRLFKITEDYSYGLKIDLHFSESWRGFEYLSSDTIFNDSKSINGIKVPCLEHSIAIDVIQPVVGMFYLHEKRKQRIQKNIEISNKEKVRVVFESIFSEYSVDILMRAVQSEEMLFTKSQVRKLRFELVINALKTDALNSLRNFIRVLTRKLYYVIKPPGVFVVFMGPDGAGKTSAIDGFKKILSQFVINDSSLQLAWRPGYLPRLASFRKSGNYLDNISKKEKLERLPSFVSSFLRYSYYVLDYVFAYWLLHRRVLVNEGFIIYDRYYYDYLIQPPYRSFINLPFGLKRLLGWMVPKPHLVICFKAEAAVLYARKQEETLEELEELVFVYNDFLNKNNFVKKIDAHEPKEKVLRDILEQFSKDLCPKRRY